MSSRGIHEVLNRAIFDEEFRRAVKADASTALADFDLTDEDRAAIESRDYGRLLAADRADVSVSTDALNPQRLGDVVLIFNVTEVVNVTPIVFLNTENVIAMSPFPDLSRADELQERGDAIVRMPGGRVDAIKELLAMMR